MKKVNIICVGKIKEKYLADGISEYAKRLSKYCELKIMQLNDYDGANGVKKESDEILQALRGYVILLDIGGALLSSEQLSESMQKAYVDGSSEISFVIGGSFGVSEQVKTKADLKISFGRFTYPHMLMRLILSEQIYRAFTIDANTPYHK